eukprot:scaffold41105_cov68-Phaeocystis_antarctica.AAC.1
MRCPTAEAVTHPRPASISACDEQMTERRMSGGTLKLQAMASSTMPRKIAPRAWFSRCMFASLLSRSPPSHITSAERAAPHVAERTRVPLTHTPYSSGGRTDSPGRQLWGCGAGRTAMKAAAPATSDSIRAQV